MIAAKKPPLKRRAAAPKQAQVKAKLVMRRAAAPADVRVVPKATTLRLKASLQEGLTVLQEVVKRPINKLVNEAVEEFLIRQTKLVESDLQGLLSRIKAVRQADPTFSASVKAFAEAESRYAGADPAEGVVVVDGFGPSQRAVRSLLGRK
jgi:hypothetical protein